MIQDLFKWKALAATLIQMEEHVAYVKFFHMSCKIIDVITTDGACVQYLGVLLLLKALKKQRKNETLNGCENRD